MHKNRLLYLLVFLLTTWVAKGQITTSGDVTVTPGVEYEIGGIEITGGNNLDKNVITLLSGLRIGDKITLPGEEVQRAIKNLWKQKLFEDIQVKVVGKQNRVVFLEIHLKELPKLSKYYFMGVKKSKKDDLRELLKLNRGVVVTENLIVKSENMVKKFYLEKGYLDAKAEIRAFPDTLRNTVTLEINVNRGNRIKIDHIHFIGNKKVARKTLKRAMDETKEVSIWNIFSSSKLLKEEYEADKRLVIQKYNELGFRDARIIKDSIYVVDEGRIGLDIHVDEGNQYYFRNITFLGNTKYSTDVLEKILQIKKGDIYDAGYLQERVSLDPAGSDIATLYLDNGYLFSQVMPVEVGVDRDSIDIEIRIREGRQATVNSVVVMGNDRTNDHVVYREIRTRPGDLFSKTDIQRTIRELAQLGYFDPQSLNVNPKPNPESGTVDLEYTVTERSTSQLELQGGWGGGRIVGTLGLNFNNFSARNIFDGSSWSPLPSGDGQTISLRAQSNGLFFQSYSVSFTEPWLGGKKPNSLTVSMYYNIQTNGLPKSDINRQSLYITGFNVGLGKRLKWPDDYFTFYQGIEFRQFKSQDYNTDFLTFNSGISNNINYKFTIGRNNTDYPIYPRRGSNFSFTGELTPPFSLMNPNKDYANLDPARKWTWIEYHKWKFNADWYTEMVDKLVLRTHAEFGFLGSYNKDLGLPPFERFYLGGDGLQNFVIDGRDIIALRGYPNFSLTPPGGGALYNKFMLELRYLLSPNPNAQIFALSFVEAGNNFNEFEQYSPFNLKRSAGVGLRIFMPMFGLLGVDLGYGFDNIPGTIGRSGWQTHFVIGQQF